MVELYDQPVVSDETLQMLLLRYNYLKYRADLACAALRETDPRATDIKRAVTLLDRVSAVRSAALRAGLPIVLSVVRRHTAMHEGTSISLVIDLLRHGNEYLLELVELYDPGKPTRFHSALTNRLLRAFAKLDNAAGARRRADPQKAAEAIAASFRILLLSGG